MGLENKLFHILVREVRSCSEHEGLNPRPHPLEAQSKTARLQVHSKLSAAQLDCSLHVVFVSTSAQHCT